MRRPRGNDWLISAAAVWGLAILGVAIDGWLHPSRHTVFDIYAAAGRNWWSGEDMYTFGREWYRYSPLFAIVISPLAFLGDALGTACWKAVNAVVFLAGVWAWLRWVLPGPSSPAVLGAALLLTLPGAMHSLHLGQANLLMLGLIFFGLAAAARQRWLLAAALLAAATLIKGYPLALALLLAAVYPRSFSWRFALALLVGLVLPFLFQTPERTSFQYGSWFHHLTASGAELNRERQRALDNLFEVLGYPIDPNRFLTLGALAGLAVGGLCLLYARQTVDSRDRLARMGMLFGTWVVLFGPATESCTYVVIAPVAAWLLADAVEHRVGWFPVSVLAAALVLSGPTGTDLFGSGVRKFTNTHGVQQLGGLLLLGYLLVRASKPLACRSAPPAPDESGNEPLRRVA